MHTEILEASSEESDSPESDTHHNTYFENNDNLRYEINKKQPYYFKNWFEHLNLTCVGSTNVALVISAYFVGYVIGIYLIEMSSKFGRKGALKMILPVYILGSSITVFS